ncbi:MAG: NAD(+) diphosphatase [Methanospirillum sp.]|uniref:NAD(+) diphosphatase n=1 Tax=Methanospirillum sp. TaxID=45200 RepID=UPI0023698CEE|nr:NAD(+) diphosphatase [Methanospirillum sp.]MDD1730154.1 NAD(+) diphosphatase [Methanospirillum sp.]
MEHHPFYTVRPLLPIYPEPEEPSSGQKRWILVQNSSVLFLHDPTPGTVLIQSPLPTGLTCSEPVYLGTREDLFYYAAEIPVGAMLPEGWRSSPVRELSGKVPDNDMAIASYAVRILDFDRSNTFCGRCGAQTRPLTTERARICTACSRITYPRISPAIIVLIKKGEEVLLARSPNSPLGFFSVIAGFNEPGENLEQTVHREVDEEVGITVRNLRYFGSEPWPFPDSLMIGFVADHAGGEIRIDNLEIEAAGWFTRDSLPPFPSKTSITRSLIEAWIRREV